MRKNYVSKLGALALAVSLITTGMMGTTLARYADKAVGTGTVAIAKWDVNLQDSKGAPLGETFIFNLAESKTKNNLVATGADNKEIVVAPGDTGVIEYKIHDEGGTQVAYKAKIELDTSGLTTTAGVIKFYKDSTYTDEWKNIDTTVNVSDAKQDIGGEIYWKWVDTTPDKDTELGVAAASETFTVTLSAEQILPTDSTP